MQFTTKVIAWVGKDHNRWSNKGISSSGGNPAKKGLTNQL